MDVDPFDEAVLADPVAVHAAIHEEAPAVWLAKYGAWFVGRDAEAREVLADWARFSSAYGVGLNDIQRRDMWQKPSVILEVDPPDHAVTPPVLNRILSPKAMRAMRAEFEQTTVRAHRRTRRAAHVRRCRRSRLPLPVHGVTERGRAAGRRPPSRGPLQHDVLQQPDSRQPARRVTAAAAAGPTASTGWRRRAAHNLEPGRFGDQIYAAVDAGEIDTETAATLVRTFLGGGIDTTVLGIGSIDLVYLCAT